MHFLTEELKQSFYNDNKKLIIANHCAPFMDGLWIHNSLDSINIKHCIYAKYMLGYSNEWLKSIPSVNFVRSEIEEIEPLTQYCGVIFPSGGKGEWKSGFYYLAKELDIPIYVMYLDYTKNEIIIKGKLKVTEFSDFKMIKDICIDIIKGNKNPWWTDYLRVFGYKDECM
jgi:1-acyl-sn-glycerol-3-phosphate acyltransferase